MQSLEELLKEVARNGVIDTTTDKVVEYQDLIGHSTVQELRELANTTTLRDSFYRVYDVAYGIVATINFYTKNDDRIVQLAEAIADQEAETEKGSKLIEDLRKANERLNDELYSFREQLAEAQMNVKEMERNLGVKDEEIIKLKARLYDLTERN